MRYLSYKYASKSCLLHQTDFLDHKNRSIYNGRYITRVTHYMIFVKHHLLHHRKYHFPNYPYYTNYSITYSIQLYRYILSIKRYNNQYRYKHTDSIIGMIINNTEMNVYTVYLLHIYTIINTILVYFNFFSSYYSYLPLKQ